MPSSFQVSGLGAAKFGTSAEPGATTNRASVAAADAVPAPALASNDDAWALPRDAAEASDLGRFSLTRALTHQGLGAWFEAWDHEHRCPVALYLPAEQADAAGRAHSSALFVAAMQPALALQHAGITPLLDVGACARGPYVAMPWLAGQSLAQALQAGWQPAPVAAVQLMHLVAQALAHAQRQGVCHGALEPANIWLVDEHTPQLRAFGVAAGAQASALPELDPLVIGPGHYLAPEQLLGETVDERTDVHALGAVLYELLTGVHAYPGHTASQVAHALLKLKPAAPHLLRPDVSMGLSDIVMRALHRNPGERYATAADVAAALAAWLKDSPAPAGAPAKHAAVLVADAAGAAVPDSRWNRARWLVAGCAVTAAVVLWLVWRGVP